MLNLKHMPEPFKNKINADVAKQLGKLVRKAHPKFPYKSYLADCLPMLPNLELKDRAVAIGDALRKFLPVDPTEAINIVTEATKMLPLDDGDGWAMFPLNALLAKHGLEGYDASMILIPEVTQRFTAEFAIRTFLENKPKKTLAILKKWAKHENMHLRRLASEGSRPRLPWAEQIKSLIVDPKPIFPLLEILKNDPEEYVRRSVANNLNDISKDHPERMLDVVEKWIINASPQRNKLIKHACRTLIKQGNPRCLLLLGYPPPTLSSSKIKLSAKQLTLGEKLVSTIKLISNSSSQQRLILDYRFHLVKANGTTAPKVFKGSTITLASNASQNHTHSFHLRPVTTRRYYPGLTRVELIANGQTIAEATFNLAIPQ